MAKFYPINPNTLYPQNIDLADASVISSDEITGLFNPQLDIVEYFIYDFNDTLLNSFYNYRNWTNTGDPSLGSTTPTPPSAVSASSVVSVPTVPTSQISTVNIDPVGDVTNIGYTFGKVKSVYNFISPKLGTSFYNKLFISEISSDRTEIRLSSNFILNDSLEISYDIFKQELDSTSYYDDFYLNFGDNQYVLSVNILLDKTSPKYSLLIKLYNPLPSNFNLKNEAYIVVKQANSLAYAVELDSNITLPDNSIPLRTANLNISVLDNINNSTDYKNLDNLLTTTSSGSFYQLLNYLSGSNINLTTDYTDYENFVFFSSADQRLSNFRQKLLIISSSQSELVGVNNITGSTSSSLAISSSKAIIESSIYTTITNFDNYERYLYYDSSSYTWPKVNNTQPYTLYDVNSVSGSNWYTSQSVTASNYDQNNQNSLYYIIPQFIRYDSNNTQYLLFVDMIGQLFDEVWLYTQNITDKLDSNSNLNVGVSPDLVHEVLTSLGVKLYGSNFTNQNLYNSLIGLNPSGGLLLPTGSLLVNNYVTSSMSASLVPTLDDFHKLTYKKIYHALPYLVKSKGTLTNIQALLDIFGVPNTVLRINEFGGKDKNFNTFDNWEEEFSYAFNTNKSSKVSTPWTASSAPYGTIYPNALEFKFKTSGLPTSSIAYSQSIVNHSTNHFNVVLEYTGSGYNTSSYSGSIKDPNYQYATLKFITGSLSASVYLPFYDGGWWSVLVNATTGSTTSYNLYAKNSIYSGSDGNILGYQASASFTGSKFWSSSGQLYFGTGSVTNGKTYTPFSGSYQEIRYYNIPLSESAFNAFVMNPNSIEGNNAEGAQSSKNSLFYRIPLGGELYTGSTSVHPGITGSSPVSQSFTGASSTASYSGSYNFVNNYQYIFFDQFAVGIQNAVSQKIKTQNIILPYTSSLGNIPTNTVLSPYISIQQNLPISSSYTADVNYVETALSPQNEINEDINSTLGYLNIGDYIGDPRLVSSSAQSYPALDRLRDLYFEKYSSNYNWSEFVSLIEQYDSSLFKMIQDFIPARDGLASGLVIKQTLLERNKYPVPQLNTFTTTSYQYLDQPFVSQNIIITGSANSLQVWDYLNSTAVFITSSLVHINGGNGGSMPDLFGQTQSIGYFSGITQSWTGSTPSNSGSVFFTQSNQSEFYNGQLSGSNLVVTTGSLSDCNVEIVQVYTTASLFSNINPNSAGDYFRTYDLNFDKTYYLSFTITEVNGTTIGNLQLWNAGNSNDVLYTSPIITAGGTLNVDKLELSGILSPLTFKVIGPSSTGFSITNFTIYESYIEPDCLVIQNNAVISRPNPYYMDVDFQTSAVVAVNLQSILSGSATRAAVPDSYYTSARQINSRYIGKELIVSNLNKWTEGDISYGKSVTVGNPEVNFVYFNSVESTSPEWGNNLLAKTQTNIRLIVNEFGSATKPINDVGGVNLGTIQQSFGDSGNATLVLDNYDTGGVNLNSLNGTWPIFKSGMSISPILYTQTASFNNSGSNIGFGYTGSIVFSQGEQGADASKINYQFLSYGVNYNSINSSTSLPYTLNFSKPVILGNSGSFNTPFTTYNPTGSLANLSSSGYILYFQAHIQTALVDDAIITYAIQKNGVTVASKQFNHKTAQSIDIYYTDTNATISSLYTVKAIAYQGPDTILVDANSYFRVTQYPLPGTGICNNFWVTGSSGATSYPNVLLASTASEGLNQYVGSRQQSIDRSGFNPITLDFEPQPYDEIRFQGIENLAFGVTSVTPTILNTTASAAFDVTYAWDDYLNIGYGAFSVNGVRFNVTNSQYVDSPTDIYLAAPFFATQSATNLAVTASTTLNTFNQQSYYINTLGAISASAPITNGTLTTTASLTVSSASLAPFITPTGSFSINGITIAVTGSPKPANLASKIFISSGSTPANTVTSIVTAFNTSSSIAPYNASLQFISASASGSTGLFFNTTSSQIGTNIDSSTLNAFTYVSGSTTTLFSGATNSGSILQLNTTSSLLGLPFSPANQLNNFTYISGSTTYNFAGATDRGQVGLILDGNIPNGTNLDYFLLRRYINDPSNIILDLDKPPGASSGGVLKPEYVTDNLNKNLDSIVQNLKSKGLI